MSRLDATRASLFGRRLRMDVKCSPEMFDRVTVAHLRELRDPAATVALIVGYVTAGAELDRRRRERES